MAGARIVPPVITATDYPSGEVIAGEIKDFKVVRIDALAAAMNLGDASGRSANVVLLGALSRMAPFDRFPKEIWQGAIKAVSPTAGIWSANYQAFMAGRDLV